MIERTRGNLIDAEVEALVNTVNTVGIMGKGVALQFRKAFPDNYAAYRRACTAGEVVPGRMFIHARNGLHNPRYIINFPTKRHWRGRSRIEDIESGLDALVREVRRLGIKSIAIPPLGCGHGGLDWSAVSRLIERAFAGLPEIHVLMYEPAGAPVANKLTIRTSRPRMTATRAVIVSLIDRYFLPGYDHCLSLLEIFKLAYFMQETGEPLKLDFQEGTYGPYADTLRHVLDRLEGHFISGVGDGRTEPGTTICLLPKATEEAEQFLESHSLTQERFARVAELIEGFETPYGMELLSSVHWVGTHKDNRAKKDLDAAVAAIHSWNDRKARLFGREQIEAAWNRLQELGWF